MRWSRRQTPFWIAVVILGATVSGALLWGWGRDGSKEADLGAAVVSTGLFGVLLIIFERALSGHAREVERKVDLAAAPPPSVDRSRTRPPDSDPSRPTARPEKAPRAQRRYTVEREGWVRDGSRIDADQLRLRVFADGEYFQFFTGIVPGSAFRGAIQGPTDITLAQFRRAVTDLTAELVRKEITNGAAPLRDPTMAIALFPDAKEAARQARHIEDSDYEEDEVVASWVA